MKKFVLLLIFLGLSAIVQAQDIQVKKIAAPKEFFEKPTIEAMEWANITEVPVSLMPQNITTPSLMVPTVKQIQVKALHNGDWIAIRLEWADATKDELLATDLVSDAVAIQFPLKDASQTSPFMGTKEMPVSIVQWKSIWQRDLEKGYQKVTDVYPNAFCETYQFGIHAAQEAGNSIANTERKNPVEEYVAAGFGSLSTQAHQDTLAVGQWKDGKWSVIFARPLKNEDQNDPQLSEGVKSSIAFAVWEGSAANVGARKNYAMWVPFVLMGQ